MEVDKMSTCLSGFLPGFGYGLTIRPQISRLSVLRRFEQGWVSSSEMHSVMKCMNGWLASWIHEVLETCLEDMTGGYSEPIGESDEMALIQLGRYVPSDRLVEFFSNSVLKIITPAEYSPSVYIAFLRYLAVQLNRVHFSTSQSYFLPFPPATAKLLFKGVASSLFETIDFARMKGHTDEDMQYKNEVNLGHHTGNGVTSVDPESLAHVWVTLQAYLLEETFQREASTKKRGFTTDVDVQMCTGGESSVERGQTEIADFIGRFMGALPHIPLEQFELLWLPFLDWILSIEAELKAAKGPEYEINEKRFGMRQDLRQDYIDVATAVFKSYLTRAVGVGCGWRVRRLEAVSVIVELFGADHEGLSELLGIDLWIAVVTGDMKVMYDDRFAGAGPQPEAWFKEARQVQPRDIQNRHLKRKRPREEWDRYASAALDYSWERVAPVCWKLRGYRHYR
ncbi:hypothetical protein QBC40DRAFT_318737 [Triangularia verruculosa]|uniref:Uncharacterized protein n=1 Tax=Triangularia verruculosa TaxID=2587418 RepID=A0AAN7AMY8_9PEZI|nr:hypothetical protein QBC40DRAFT_318737 [Triangularia verruculosa]